MTDTPTIAVHPPRRRSWRGLLIGLVVAFVLGVASAVLLLGGGDLRPSDLFRLHAGDPPVAQAPLSGTGSAASVTPQALPTSAARVAERFELVEQQAGGIDSRVAALEQRLNHLDMQSQAAASFAVRSENLLIAFASRRALERGQPLGYLADQLRLRFSETHPNAVQTVINASVNPVSLDQLLVDLDMISDQLETVPEDTGLFDRIGTEVSRLFSVRREDSPSPVAEQRIERARAALSNGQVERAIGEVRLMPGAANARGWLVQAQAYADAQRALEVLEAASVSDPRMFGAAAPALAVPAGD